VWIEISDNGSGIPKAIQSRIFDPFFTTKPIGSGTGLGLSLSYGIIQKHHGRIDVQSEAGEGSTFRIELPVKQERQRNVATEAI
jgi:signal transduction histidine kinase